MSGEHNSSVTRYLLLLATLLAVSLSVFQIWQGISAQLSAPVFRPVHLGWVLVLVFLVNPLVKEEHAGPKLYPLARLADLVLMLIIRMSNIVGDFLCQVK